MAERGPGFHYRQFFGNTASGILLVGRDSYFIGLGGVVSDGQTPLMGDTERAVARDLSLRGVRPPVKVPGYDQEQFLGHGAYGEVWVAVNRNSGRKVAIKFFTRRGGTGWAALAREVEKLRYLFSDRYVVQLFEVGWESDPPAVLRHGVRMENGSLEDLLRSGPIPFTTRSCTTADCRRPRSRTTRASCTAT